MKLDYSEYPIDFTVPHGDTKKPRTLRKGAKGGDGGAAERKAAEDARISLAINKLNQVFGLAEATPESVDRASFTSTINTPDVQGYNNEFGSINYSGNANKSTTKSVFDSTGYNAAVAAAQAKADKLKGASSAREALYSKIGTDSNNMALVDLNKERGITERELKFSLARNGLSGGSRDIDANKDVLDTYQQGVLKASNIGLQTANNARSNDEKTRVNLINSIHAGLTDSDAMTQAYTSMANNAKQAQDEANNTSLAGFFDVLKNQQANAQYNAGVSSVGNQTAIDAAKNSPYYNTMKNGNSGTVRSY